MIESPQRKIEQRRGAKSPYRMKWIVTVVTAFGALVVASPASAKVSYSGTISYKRSFAVATDAAGTCMDGGNGAPNEFGSESWQIHFKHLRATPTKTWGVVRVPITGSFSDSVNCPNDPDGYHVSDLLNRAGTVRLGWSIYKRKLSLTVADGPGLKGTETTTSWGVVTTSPGMFANPGFMGRLSQPPPPGYGRAVTVRARTGKTTIKNYVVNWTSSAATAMNKTTGNPGNPGEPGTLVESVKRVRN
jgi:hypothetical protein